MNLTFSATKQRVLNRGTPPDSFLHELVEWGRAAAEEIFVPNPNPADVYASVSARLGPFVLKGRPLYRRAVMLEVMRVLAGFEATWNWNEGVDTTNSTSVTPDTIEAGVFQVSANSIGFGADLKVLVLREVGTTEGDHFQHEMKSNHALSMEYIARLLRHTCRHNGPVLRHEIDPWLRRDAVAEFEALLS